MSGLVTVLIVLLIVISGVLVGMSVYFTDNEKKIEQKFTEMCKTEKDKMVVAHNILTEEIEDKRAKVQAVLDKCQKEVLELKRTPEDAALVVTDIIDQANSDLLKVQETLENQVKT